MTFCGPKLSICCTLLSAWAVIQLGLMGVFFIIRAPNLIEDLHIPEDIDAHTNPQGFIDAMDASYHQIAINCWIATALYAVTFVVSGWQMYLNVKN